MDCHVAALLAKAAEGRWLFFLSLQMAVALQQQRPFGPSFPSIESFVDDALAGRSLFKGDLGNTLI